MWVKQSTAATLIVGPILDSAGAEYASAVIGDLSISKNGGTLTALAAAATLTHIANGQYTLVMTTGNLDTLGRLQITCNKSTYQMPEVRLMVVPAMVFDSMILGSDRFDVNVTHVTDTAQTAGDIYASQVAIAGYIDTEVSAIKAKTDNLPSDPADQSAIEAAITAATSPLATQASVNTIDDFLDTEIAAIKTKTDQLTFTTANKVDSTAVLDSAVGTQITAIETFATRMTTGLVQDGAVYQFTANMLELGPSGGGGSSVNVLPATGIVSDRSAGTTLLPVVGETISQSITVYQSDGTTAVSLSGKTLKVIFETMSGVDVAVVAAADITISGASSNVVTFAYPSAVTASERTLRFAIRDAAAPLTMYLQGVCSVVAAPKVDA